MASYLPNIFLVVISLLPKNRVYKTKEGFYFNDMTFILWV